MRVREGWRVISEHPFSGTHELGNWAKALFTSIRSGKAQASAVSHAQVSSGVSSLKVFRCQSRKLNRNCNLFALRALPRFGIIVGPPKSVKLTKLARCRLRNLECPDRDGAPCGVFSLPRAAYRHSLRAGNRGSLRG